MSNFFKHIKKNKSRYFSDRSCTNCDIMIKYQISLKLDLQIIFN